MQKVAYKYLTLASLTLLCLAILFLSPRMPQPLSYHDFADKRIFLGIPNTFDVLSNLALFFVGILGMRKSRPERTIYFLFFLFIALSGIGSAYYHWAPDNLTLFWDRLAIAVASQCFLAAIISERINARLGVILLIPLMIFGILSTLVWRLSELSGQGDLRLYAFAQFFPLVIIPVILWLYPSKQRKIASLVYGFLCLGLARIGELFDQNIFNLSYQTISGHTLKHLFAALAVYFVLNYCLSSLPSSKPR